MQSSLVKHSLASHVLEEEDSFKRSSFATRDSAPRRLLLSPHSLQATCSHTGPTIMFSLVAQRLSAGTLQRWSEVAGGSALLCARPSGTGEACVAARRELKGGRASECLATTCCCRVHRGDHR